MYNIAILLLNIFPKDSILMAIVVDIFTLLLTIGKNQIISFVHLKMTRKWKYDTYTHWNIINYKEKLNDKILMTMHRTVNIIISEVTQVLKDKCWMFSLTCTPYLLIFLYVVFIWEWMGGVMLLEGAHERRKGSLKGESLCADEFSFSQLNTS